MSDTHTPDPRFVENLEWQLGRELRRSRTGTTPQSRFRGLKIAGLMLGSVALGAAAMEATQQLGESWRKELLEARLSVQFELAQQRLQMHQETEAQTREQVDAGLRGEEELWYLELQITQADADVRLRGLELEELQASGREPLDELSSPLVDGRDFVTERLQIQADIARRHVEVLRSEAEREEQRAAVGVAAQQDVQGRDLAVAEAERHLRDLTQQLQIRRAYLDGEISAVEAELKLLEAEAQNRVALLEQTRGYFELELERAHQAIDLGTLSPIVATQMETRLAEWEAQVRLARAELEIVQRELARQAERR